MRNKLFTASVDKMLFKQYPLGDELEKQKVVAKIFNPYGDGRWYLLNSDPEDPDYIWAIVSMFGNVEIGSVSRSELLGARIRPFGLPLERDLYFTPQNAAEVYRGLLDGKFYKKGGVTDDLEKELRKLQRDLNSSRLSTYTEGDNSAEEMARQAERAAKLARFDEVLRLLRESDAKFAKGGGISDSDREKSIAELKRKIKHFREVEKSEPMARYYEEALFYMTEGKENDILKRGKYAKGGEMSKGDKYYVMDAKDGKILSKGFDTDEEAIVEMYDIFEKTGIFSLTIKKMSHGGYMAEGGEIVKERNGKLYREEWAGSNRWLEVDSQFKMTKDEHEAKAFQENLNGNYESRDNHKHIAATLSGEPIQLQEHHNRYMAKGGLTNLQGTAPVKKYDFDSNDVNVVQ